MLSFCFPLGYSCSFGGQSQQDEVGEIAFISYHRRDAFSLRKEIVTAKLTFCCPHLLYGEGKV